MKLIAAMRSGLVSDYRRVAQEKPFPFHRESDFFKLNLFPIAFQNVNAALWVDRYRTLTGLPTREAYLDWCRNNRFPQIQSWLERGRPKLVVGIGASYKDDYRRAFGFNGLENVETIEGQKLVWMSTAESTLAIIPFLGWQNGLLNSDQRLQAFGERLGALFRG